MIYKGTKRDDVYLGTAAADVIEGFAGKDRLSGAGGNDQIAGGEGDDTLDGGEGDDILFSDGLGTVPLNGEWHDALLDTLGSRDVLSGDLGNDTIFAGTGDVVDGGDGVDRLALSLIRETAGLKLNLDALVGGGTVSFGSTTITGIEQLAALQATAFDDEIHYLAAADRAILSIDAADGNDRLVLGGASGGYATGDVFGGAGDDLIQVKTGFSGRAYGGDGDDQISNSYYAYGGAGDDVLTGNTRAYGGDGNDVLSTLANYSGDLWGEAGDDTLTGGTRNDFIYGGDGSDTLVGGLGNDTLWSGGDGFGVVDTGAEFDRIDAGVGDDQVWIGFGDTAAGGAGRDALHLSLVGATAGVVLNTTAFYNGGTVHLGGGTISGFEYFDRLEGSNFDDQITAYGGVVVGGDGNDRLISAGTRAELYGGSGDDIVVANGHGYWYDGSYGNDTVTFAQLKARIVVDLSATGSGRVSTGEWIGGFDTIVATPFADVIDLDYSSVSVLAGAGNDRITFGVWNGQVFGGTGDDILYLYNGGTSGATALVSGGEGQDRLISYGNVDLSRIKFDGTIEWIDVSETDDNGVTMAGSQIRGVTRIDTGSIRLSTAGLADFRATTLNVSRLDCADAGSRVLIGANSTISRIYGHAGVDTITSSSAISCMADGGDGNDVISFAAVTAPGVSMTLLGGMGNDRLIGSAAADTLDGGVGKDLLQGGLGDDRYLAVDATDVIQEAVDGGTDTVETWVSCILAANVENLVLLGDAASGTGNASANTITANAYSNILDGKGGADVMIGGDGSDTYYVDNVGDQVIEDELHPYVWTDTVRASVDYTLGKGVENLTMIAPGHTGIGNELANVIVGSTGVDTLYGMDGDDDISSSGGADRMIGGNGDDTYHVDGASDLIVEAVNGGADRVIASANYTLSENVESLELIGDARVGQGNSGTNTITGSAGDDTLRGMGGIDVLTGGAGNDTLWGGTGQDALFGDTGADIFAFARGDSSADWTQADGIVDFSKFDHDRIDLTAFGHLSFIGTAGFNGGPQVRFEDFDGDTLISIDTNGDRTADMVIGVIGPVSFTAADFILV